MPLWLPLLLLLRAHRLAAAEDEDWHRYSNAGKLSVPGMLDCEGDGWPQEWRYFRLAASEAVGHGFARSEELRNTAAKIEEQWRHWVCPIAAAEPGQQCRSSGELGFTFVKELHRECRDSNNFERYFIRHYFDNTKTPYELIEEPSGFCVYGYLTALMVLAWHSLPDEVANSLRYVYTAKHLLGHYHSFDFLESSSWPITSFLVLVNFHAGGTWMPLVRAPEYSHPGQHGASFYYERLAWAGTVEALKAKPGAAPFFWLPFGPGPPRQWRGLGGGTARPHIVVWQFCIHTSTAGEAVTMITRFLHEDYNVEFWGNSLATQLCSNYRPSLCATGRNLEFLDWLSARFEQEDTPYEELSQRFQKELLPELSKADVWMCSIPAVWCRLLADAGRSPDAPQPHRPVFVYLGLPLLQYVKKDEREDFMHAFVEIGSDERNLVAANNAYLAEEVLWQTGLKVPTLRIHGLHTNATYLPLRASEVLVSRPGTSGGWQECVLNRFVDANPGYPLKFVQFTNLLNPNTKKEVYNNSLSYTALSQFRAVVGFPYDTSLMFFWEFYSMNMPVFVPFQLWHWGIFGQHTRPDLEEPRIFPSKADSEGHTLSELRSEEERIPYSPFFDGFAPLDVERSIFWSKYTDWAMFPHVQYFESVPDLMAQLVVLDLQAVSAAMKQFNEECLVKSVATWRYVVERWLDLETFTHPA
eukprot:TRINITY_DN98479_c0_g1_i1.p1 TRINITY_DN98479_c0_g1~~TRINITY_DN98479_c0_g1_i1.p1  ORF type:complete len:697 (+),score=140.47 TRINITY_DN98479_c0_g1_i1:48-2138(+)